jgi:hypothetical protein
VATKSNNKLMRRLIEERDGKQLIDSNVHASSSSCTINFAQTNPQPSGTSAGDTSQPNQSAQLMNHFYSRTTIDGSTPAYEMPQQTLASTFGQGYMHATPSFSMPNPGLAPYTPGCNGRTYTNTNSNYQVLYTTVVYTDPIPLPDSSARPWPNYANNNTMWYTAYGQMDHSGYGY